MLDVLLGTVARGVSPGDAIYVRISMDRTGAGLGVARQLKECLALCQRLGRPIYDVYVDNDTSAYSRKPRKEWLRMLADINAGNVSGIVCWHVDRLTRSPRELEDVIALHDRHGIDLATCTGDIDLGTPTGKLVARVVGAAARQEVEHKSERQQLQNRQAAEAGKVRATGKHRPFGWSASGDPTVVEEEAEAIRSCTTRVLAGESLSSVCRSMNASGVVTTTGRQWTVLAMNNLLLQARISGRREYNPVVRGKARPPIGEILATDAFPAIITPAQSDQLRSLLADPTRAGKNNGRAGGTGAGRGQARKYLLSGILRCGLPGCGAGLKGRIHNGQPRYQCVKQPGKGGCNGVAIRARLADGHIRDLVLTALDNPKLFTKLLAAASKEGVTDPDQASKELRAIDAKREELAEAWANDEMTRKEWLAAKNRLDARADTITRKLATNEHAQALLDFARMDGDVWHRWETLTAGGKRALVAACIDHAAVHRLDPTKPRKIFDPDRIRPLWRV